MQTSMPMKGKKGLLEMTGGGEAHAGLRSCISADAYDQLVSQYESTKRLDLTGEAFSGLTEAGLAELAVLFPELEAVFSHPGGATETAESIASTCLMHNGFVYTVAPPVDVDANLIRLTEKLTTLSTDVAWEPVPFDPDIAANVVSSHGWGAECLLLDEDDQGFAYIYTSNVNAKKGTAQFRQETRFASWATKDKAQVVWKCSATRVLLRRPVVHRTDVVVVLLELKAQLPSLKVAHLGAEITPDAYDQLVSQYESTKRLDLTGEAYSGLTEAGLGELAVLLPEL